ncbi:hypothetical protein [Brevibacillus reuszeri]|uniref:hypothetical protein n=1 Tax=Brevibacillus reuszeri TaxID=54915 RepID=UPI000A53DC97|nr:hypothetical protein [Brevibacillus reuszeri]MED1861262.1 hypothetical protein [Brevibacillus reuszeri]
MYLCYLCRRCHATPSAEVARKAFAFSSAKTLIDHLAGLMMFVASLLIIIR